ncbi:hypothetical protein PRUB_a1633 [Pseudoalteromonas rubra]|uniref:Glycosyltransferase (GlcNAc) n=1 Tax=Pseudoalteromonas rubra TaxID=43658 RepID=A0A8T0CFS3_9GAMM|nr:GlcNAc-transferase family protein [Pseudoalteromonas rubra]KAF7788621.1 hypothetical protein PRUB_a1633 [Pseudoalteromonas rubra]
MNASIFVQIAAYRDPELLATIRSAVDNASDPQRLVFGVCWQYIPGLDEYLLFPSELDADVRLVAVPVEQAQGVCWARHVAQNLYRDEDYVLSVDSHTRFVVNWDKRMIEELTRCPSDKPVLTTYPAPFRAQTSLADTPIARLKVGPVMDGSVRFEPFFDADTTLHTAPIASHLCACGFYFAQGQLNHDLPIDPIMYFNQEEFTHSLKLWTLGYDCFIPSQHLVLHQYGKEKPVFEQHVHWNDDAKWVALNTRAQIRLRALIEHTFDPAHDSFPVEHFPLGKARTTSQYLSLLALEYRDGELYPQNSETKATR